MFKAGDKVKKKNGETFMNGEYEVIVDRISGETVWFTQTGSYADISSIELVNPLLQFESINDILDKPTVLLTEGTTNIAVERTRPDSDHYHEGGIDVWQFADANFDYDELFGFHKINVIKYIARFGKKNGRNIRDLEKARAVLDEMIRMELSK